MENKRKNEALSPKIIDNPLTAKECFVIQLFRFITTFYAVFSIFFIMRRISNYKNTINIPLSVGIILLTSPIGYWISKIIKQNLFLMFVIGQFLLNIVVVISFWWLELQWTLVGTVYYAVIVFALATIGVIRNIVFWLSSRILPGDLKAKIQIWFSIACFAVFSTLMLLFVLCQAHEDIGSIFLANFPILAAGLTSFIVFRDKILADKRNRIKILLCLSMLFLAGFSVFVHKILLCLERKTCHNGVIFSAYTSSC
ncbi:MAG: hypothetical protein LBS14_02545 [Holosporaceae bacterium]|nr:hypothetical protein [Holosporaceae bacterium]